MATNENPDYDVIIIGSGVSGALLAKHLGTSKKAIKILVMEAGAENQPNNNEYMHRFYEAASKVPESPYTPETVECNSEFPGQLVDPATVKAGRPTVLALAKEGWREPKISYLVQKGPLPFGSTYERIAGGTRHWLGTSLRLLPDDLRMKTKYGKASDWPAGLVDWPLNYEDLSKWYCQAECELGVSANKEDQHYSGVAFPNDYSYPMPAIPGSVLDQALSKPVANAKVDDVPPLSVRSTPAARNSQPYQQRRVCAGNTNCIPICPIQAKYDPTITLLEAINTKNVKIWYQTVAYDIAVGNDQRVTHISFKNYSNNEAGKVSAKIVVVAANAIETPRLLLMSNNNKGIANSSKVVGKYLMDHPYYVAWALAPDPVWPFRGPLITSGLEEARNGDFRRRWAAFRVDIGNEGWQLPIGDPATTTLDFITGANKGGLNDGGPNGTPEALSGRRLVERLNGLLRRQFRLGFLVEQTPDETNCVALSEDVKDGLGLRRPQIRYDLSEYTKRGLAKAKETASAIFKEMGAREYTSLNPDLPSVELSPGNRINIYGAGHIVGTCRMGTSRTNSVVNSDLRSWDHPNLYIAGSSVFPTVATANPTLTIAALTVRLAETIVNELGGRDVGIVSTCA
jgi:choline dehydrogenase-like flavoprotein